MTTKFIIVVAFLFIAPLAFAQNFWKQVAGLQGGRVNCLVVNQANGHLFAGTFAGLFRSTDNGANWTQVKVGFPNVEVTTILQRSADQMFAGTLCNGIYRSTDSGASWMQINSGITNYLIKAIVAYGDLYAAGSAEVYRSTDNGGSWITLKNGLPNAALLSLALHSSGYVYVGTEAGAYRSADSGANWSAINTGLPAGAVRALLAHPGGMLVAGTDQGLYSSSNNGASWERAGLSGTRVDALTLGPVGDPLAGTSLGTVFRSTDNGLSWASKGDRVALCAVRSIAVTNPGQILVGTDDGVYILDADGRHWSRMNKGLAGVLVCGLATGKRGIVLAGSDGGGVFRSTDYGTSFAQTNLGLGNLYVRSIVVTPSGAFLVGTEGGIFRSTDNGDSWIAASTGLPGGWVTCLSQNERGTLFAGVGNGVFMSADNGETWGRAGTGLPGAYISALVVSPNQRIFVGTFNSPAEVYRSADDGEHWSLVRNGLPSSNNSVSALACRPDHNVFAAVPEQGVYRTADDGANWTTVNAGLTDLGVFALAVNSSGHILAGTVGGGGTFRSRDRGESWTAVNTGLTYNVIYALAFDDSGYAYAGTWGGGVFRSTSTTIELPPPLLAPANGAVDQPTSVTLTWGASPNAQSYHVQVSGDSLFRGTLLVNDSTVTGTTKSLSGLVRSIRYYWRVKVRVMYGANSPFSEKWSFQVAATALPAVIDTYWQRPSGPYGGRVASLALNSSGHLFASTPGGVFRSTDNGERWNPLTAGRTSGAECMLVHPSGMVFVGTSINGLHRSTDNGEQWTRLEGGWSNNQILALAANSRGHLFVAPWEGGVYRSTDKGETWQPISPGFQKTNVFSLAVTGSDHIFAGTSNGLYRSTDHGGSWTQVSAGLTNTDVRFLFAGADGTMFAGTFTALFRSTDNGSNWSESSSPLTKTPVVALVMKSDGSILAGTNNNGVIRSTDRGVTWEQVNTGLSDLDVRSLGVNAGGHVFAGTNSSGVFRSVDNEKSWVQINNGLTNHEMLALATGASGSVFGATIWQASLFQSSDNGGSWTQPNSSFFRSNDFRSFAISPKGYLFAGTLDGVNRSTDEGKSWVQRNSGLPGPDRTIWSIAFGSSGSVFAGLTSGLYRSTDDGDNWTRIADLPGNANIHALAVAPNGHILAGTGQGDFFRSTDNGATWKTVDLGLGAPWIASFAIDAGGQIFAGGGSGVFRSTDNGGSWTQGTSGLQNNGVASLVVNTAGDLFAGTGAGVFRSTDKGATWAAVSTTPVKCLALNAAGFLFAGTTGLGILRSVRSTTGALTGDPYEPNGTAANATPIAYSFKSSEAEIQAGGDVDYYKFNARAGDFVSIEATTDPVGSLDIRISLYDPVGNELASADFTSTGTERILYGISTTQAYYIRVVEASDTSTFPQHADDGTTHGKTASSFRDKSHLLTGISYAQSAKAAKSPNAYILTLSLGSPLPPAALSAGSGFNGLVPLHWSPPASNSVQEYRVYRSTSTTGSFELLGASWREDFVDTTAVNDIAYFYTVKSVYGATNAESGPSNVGKATPRAAGFKIPSRSASTRPTIDGIVRANEWSDAEMNTIHDRNVSAQLSSVTLLLKNDGTTLYVGVIDSNGTASTFSRLLVAFDGDFNKTWGKIEPADEGFVVVDEEYGFQVVRFLGVTGDYPQSNVYDEIRNPKGITSRFSYVGGAVHFEMEIDLARTASVIGSTGSIGLYVEVVSDVVTGQYPPQGVLLAPSTFGQIVLAKPAAAKLPGEYSADQNTALLLHLNETSGSLVVDASGNGNNGSAIGGTSIVDGRFGKARRMSANGDQINIAHSSSLNFGTGSYTLEAWINTLGLSDPGGHPFHKRGTNGRGWFWMMHPTGEVTMSVYNNGSLSGEQGVSSLMTTRSIGDGRWHHIASIVTPNTMTFYVDGALDATGTVSIQGSADNSDNLTLGSNAGASSIFKGLIEEVRISNKARSPQEFNLQLPPKGISASLVGSAINVLWQNSGGAVGLLRYKIYRGADSTNVALIDSTTSSQYSNSGLSAGTRYYYRVSAVDSTGFESAKSYAASAVTSVPAPSPPTLSGPANNATGQPTTVTLAWTAVTGATAYHVQVATNSSFTAPLVYEDASYTATSKQLTGLAENSTFYWRVLSKNAGGSSSWSSSTFSTAGTKTVTSTGISYPSSPKASTDYRLVSFPGASGIGISQFLSGTQNTDWRIFEDNGAAVPNNLSELSASSTVDLGQGYWLLTKGTFTYSRSTMMPQLSSDGSCIISVRTGWNIIGNPFDVSVSWASVKQLNSVSANLWAYSGTSGFQQSSTLAPFVGYYFFSSSTSLRIPYPFPTMKVLEAPLPSIDWKIQVVLETDRMTDAENFVGVASTAREEQDQLDQEEPPRFQDQASLAIVPPAEGSQHILLSADYRPSVGAGKIWKFQVTDPQQLGGKIRILGIESLPAELEATMMGVGGTGRVNLREVREMPISSGSETTWFYLAIGNRDFIEQQEGQLIPKEFELSQNYPNPFNPRTAISYQLSAVSLVTLTVFDPLGREIASLVRAEQSPGRYQVSFDAGDLPSGIYFYRLHARTTDEGSPQDFVDTKKLVLVK